MYQEMGASGHTRLGIEPPQTSPTTESALEPSQ